MLYLTALRGGVSPEMVAHAFATKLVRASLDAGELCPTMASNFVNDTLRAMGISGKITPEQIKKGDFNFDWPTEELQIYSFHYNKFEFARVEMFLAAMCWEMEMDQQNNAFLDTLTEEELDSGEPLELLMQLMALWCKTYKQLLNGDNFWGTANMFVEPLSRINFHLFVGMHKLRKNHRDVFPILDKICQRLYQSAILGLRYQQTHEMVLQGSLKIIAQDLEIFRDDAILFLHEAFIVEYTPATYRKLYQFLQTLLAESDGNRLNILTDILIKKDMLDIYFTTLVTKESRKDFKQQQHALQLLNVLQSKLLTLDCFSREFMESILYVILQANTKNANLACNLYVTMMKRKMSEEMILKHILEFYVTHTISTSQLKDYVSHFYNNFPYMHNIHNLLEVVSDATEVIRLLCFQIVVTIFEIIFETNDYPHKVTGPFIQILPEIVESLSDQRYVGILLRVLTHITFEPQELERQTTDNFIHYAVKIFMQTENNYEYPILMNIFTNFHKCLLVTKEWHHLELISDHLMTQYREIIQKLEMIKNHKQRNNSITSLFPHFSGVLKRMSIIIKTDYDVFDDLPNIVNSLQKYVLVYDTVESLNESYSLMDVYALDIYVSGIIKLAHREPEHTISTSFCFTKAVLLQAYLEKLLENTEEFVKLPAFRMKVYFCGLLSLYCQLPITLTTETYYRMIQILIAVLVVPKSSKGQETNCEEMQQIHPFQAGEYHRAMLQHFTEMHKFQHIEIKSNVVWKLCIHYGKPQTKFNDELKHLLITLATYRFNIYKHINAVVIYNLYKQQPPLKNATITLVLKRYRHLIDNEIHIDSPDILKVDIVLLVLQIVEKALSVQRIGTQSNRVKALKHLHIFLKDIDLSALQAEDLLLEQLTAVESHLLTKKELKIFANCQRELDIF